MNSLKKVRIGDSIYFIDERLEELRNVNNPQDIEKMEGSTECYLDLFEEVL